MTDVTPALRIERARIALGAARTLVDGGFYTDSVNRSHLVIELAALAVLGSKGLTSKTHTGVETLFFTHFIKPGLMDARFGKMLSEARMARLTADYSGMADVPAAKAAEHLANAETFLAADEAFLIRLAAP